MKKEKKDKKPKDLTGRLNVLLASYQVAYFNTRASHWMVKGENFFELHKVFETAYNDATVKIDEIAERILTLGGIPYMTATEMIANSDIKEHKQSGDESSCVKGLLEDLTKLTVIEKDIVMLADEEEDVVTADMMTRYMGEQQKNSWMLYQFLNRRSAIK